MAGHVVRRRELVQALVSNGDGVFKTLARLRVNPGSRATFPWLSVMAPLYESYRFRRLKFIVVTRLPTTTTGSMIMSPDYDAADGEIAITEAYIFNNMGSTDSPVWEKEHTLQLSPAAMNRLYKSHVCMSDTRFGASAQDQKTVDAAQVFICTDHIGTSGVMGKLLVDYEVEFFNPQAPTDPLQFGGVRLTQDAPNLNPLIGASQIPIAGGVAGYTTELEEKVPIGTFPGVDANPTHTVFKFLRDYQGTVQMLQQGVGLSSADSSVGGLGPALVLDKVAGLINMANPGSSAVPVSGFVPKIFDVAQSKRTDLFNILAKAGDFLKVQAGASTSTNDLKLLFGGSSASSAF
jgi:hypothetical protein